MSMNIHVVFRGRLPARAALEKAMGELGFPFTFRPGCGPLDKAHGYQPMRFRGRETGVEFRLSDDEELLEELREAGADPAFDRIAAFRFGGDLTEAAAASCAAAALAKLVGGVVFDDDDASPVAPEDAAKRARRVLQEIDAPKRKKPPTPSSPGEIRKLLKPLLALRPDLALVGRMLIIRPVRHVLRGVYLARTIDPTEIELRPFAYPLYESPQEGTTGHPIVTLHLTDPDDRKLLLDMLLQEVFPAVAPVRGLLYYGQAEKSHRNWRASALLMCGLREEARSVLGEWPADAPPHIEPYRVFHDRRKAEFDEHFAALLARRHADEARNAKTLKIERFWRATPFPAEVPEADRPALDEPAFSLAPWAPLPENAFAPDRPGMVRFARAVRWRGGRLALLVPLTAEEAENSSLTYRPYVLVTRLPQGPILWLSYVPSPRDLAELPRCRHPYPLAHYYLTILGAERRIYAFFWEMMDRLGALQLEGLDVWRKDTASYVVHFSFLLFLSKTIIDDNRNGSMERTEKEFDPNSIFGMPDYKSYGEFLEKIYHYLHSIEFDPSDSAPDHSDWENHRGLT